MKGRFPKGATEVVLTRTLVFPWSNPIETPKAPVTAGLQLVLRRRP